MTHSPIRLSGTNLERAADHNQRVTLHAIRVNGPITRVDLARITGLTAPSIANITKRLAAEGLIEDAGQIRGGRGQPATKLVVNKAACYSLGVNIDRDHITIVLVDFAGEVMAQATRDIAFPKPEDVRDHYRVSAAELVAQAGIDPALLVGVGVAMPDDFGLIDLPGRPDDFALWESTDIASLLAEPFGLPVFVENDAAAAAMGEQQLGHGLKAASFFYLLISSGLGGGLVIDGNYIRGAQGRSGEIGFLLERGTGEQIQNLVSLSGVYRLMAGEGLKPADLRGDEAALMQVRRRWIDMASDQLVEPLVAVSCLINPAAVIIGGRLPGGWIEDLVHALNTRLESHRHHVPVLAPVMKARLAEEAPSVGAAVLPFSHFLLPKATALWKGSTEG
ncbi:ROK family transcriptional regulator [Novosphingobium sediminicola]|uniref:Putative NBD/HSP70 family sugar kinase n=1 Tax=Novosphingobium sediminicola TaxID=563162 RepID=A0A7W6CBY6_9SPHN|nr:ROK family transcriptional regulator [Novosphingobium sediminicola]MBB3953746.1 putative NBD/HSP70 family sugar kinase [Novosphingobium sediminicola]